MDPSKAYTGIDLESLILEKDFHMLSLEERAAVLLEISEREYRHMREIVRWSQKHLRQPLREPKPLPEIRIKLHHAATRHSSKTKIQRFLTYPIPAWQAAAAILLLVLGIQLATFSTRGTDASSSGIWVADTTHTDSSFRLKDGLAEDSVFANPEDSL